MSDYRERLFDEHTDLYKKIEKLKNFIVSTKYDELPEIDRTDLRKQLGYMKAYFSVLNRRVSRQCGDA